jgi:AcrR family transcriptional regulator
VSQERLLEVAREVFLELGIRATTAEVAARAGVAEGTIFHRYKSKAELFRAAMQFDPEQALAFAEQLPERAGTGELRATLIEFGERFLELGRIALPVMMMSWSNPEAESCLERATERGSKHRRVLGAVSAFFEAEMRAGRLRQGDAEVLARMLIGSLHHFCMAELVSGGRTGRLSEREFVAAAVDVLLSAAERRKANE